MKIDELILRFSGTKDNQQKAIFNTLFIVSNKLQTLFDNHIPELSLKQFLLLSVVRQTKEYLTFTQLGEMLGCSRQNIKKIADVLMKKGFVIMRKSTDDPRAMCIFPTEKSDIYFQNDFSKYQEELKNLFQVYTDEEVKELFLLLSKLYSGIDNLEKKSTDKKL